MEQGVQLINGLAYKNRTAVKNTYHQRHYAINLAVVFIGNG